MNQKNSQRSFIVIVAMGLLVGSMCCAFMVKPNWGTPSDLQKMGLIGAVKFVGQRVYEVRKDQDTIKKRQLVLDPLENWDLDFNKQGYITQKKCYGAANELIFYYNYKYKRKHQLLRKNMYDHRNYQIEQVLYVYNSLGQVAAESIYRADNTLLVRYIYTYSSKGKLTQTDVHAPSKIYTTSKYKFYYDDKGQLTKQQTYNSQEQLHQTDDFIYDENAYLKEHRIKSHPNGFTFTSYSRYDDKGNLITYQAPAEKEPLTSYTYTFDAIGNWVTRTHYKNGKPHDLVERQIIYD